MVSREGASTDEQQRAWLLEERAAVRRNAALVMRGAPLPELLAAVAEEVGRLVHADIAHVVRYDGDHAVVEAVWSDHGGLGMPLGVRVPVAGHNIATLVKRTRQPARFDTYAHASGPIAERLREMGVSGSVGLPVLVNDRLWGTIVVSVTRPEPLPSDTENRVVDLTELTGAAIWALQVRQEMSRLVEEQAALRRVATLVARGAPPAEILTAVAREVGQVLEVDATAIYRIEPGGDVTIVTGWNKVGGRVPTGGLGTVDDEGVAGRISRSGRPARVDDFTNVPGLEAALARRMGYTAGAGGPIFVNRRLWGVIAAAVRTLPMPVDAELRMSEFTELIATAISNAQARTDLAASRARIVATSDETRRRIERDLHDGTQQRLVSLGLDLRTLQRSLPPQQRDQQAELGHIVDSLNDALDELREISRGIHPAILSQGGPLPRPQGTRPPCRDSRGARGGHPDPPAGAGRGGGLLRRQRGAHQRRQARQGVDGTRERRHRGRAAAHQCPRRRRGRRRPHPRLRARRPHRPGRGARRNPERAQPRRPGDADPRRASHQRELITVPAALRLTARSAAGPCGRPPVHGGELARTSSTAPPSRSSSSGPRWATSPPWASRPRWTCSPAPAPARPAEVHP
nr:hypothetical protein GCM10020063_000720 [Dactylosporangium thailandense]